MSWGSRKWIQLIVGIVYLCLFSANVLAADYASKDWVWLRGEEVDVFKTVNREGHILGIACGGETCDFALFTELQCHERSEATSDYLLIDRLSYKIDTICETMEQPFDQSGVELTHRYQLFPTAEDWIKILDEMKKGLVLRLAFEKAPGYFWQHDFSLLGFTAVTRTLWPTEEKKQPANTTQPPSSTSSEQVVEDEWTNGSFTVRIENGIRMIGGPSVTPRWNNSPEEPYYPEEPASSGASCEICQSQLGVCVGLCGGGPACTDSCAVNFAVCSQSCN